MNISVIIPCHNAGRWIAAALRSVAQQTYPTYEIIVIDDGSTDDSITQIESSGVSVKLLHVDNLNAAAARNAGIEVAVGDWVALLDADDAWYSNHLARAAELLDGTDNVAFMSNHDWISLKGEVIPIPTDHRCKLSAPRSCFSVDDYYIIGENGFHFGHSTVVYRRNRVLEAGLFDPTQVRRHDIDLWLRVIADRPWIYDTVKGAGYRENTPGSISGNEQECDYYYLRALIKNLPITHSRLHRKYLTRQARRAMGIAFVDSPEDHYARIHTLAWPYLPWAYKVFYAGCSVCPGLLRYVIKMKRRVVMGDSQ
jgi:glycosyltransferase involved in cell wall biosynthesis